MWKHIMLSLVFAACQANVPAATDDCQSPSVQVPQNLARQIVRRMIRDKTPNEQKQLIRNADNRRGGIAGSFCAKAVDLDKDGKPDMLIQFLYSADLPGCGTANCLVWAYRRTNKGYELLLEGWGIGHITALRASTNGYLDLKTTARESAAEHEITIYKFDGRQYQARECISETYVEDDRDKGRWKSKRHKCN